MKLKEFWQEQTYRQGIVLFIGGMIANALNYFYRVLMGRMLNPELYGELTVIVSFFLILIVPTAPLQLVAAKFSAVFEAENFSRKLKRLFIYLTKITTLASLALTGFIVFFACKVQDFLKLSSINYVYILAGTVAVTLISGITKGVLQGLKRFSKLSCITVLEAVARIAIAWVLVSFGFRMVGALSGFFVPPVLLYFLALYFIRDVVKTPDNPSGDISGTNSSGKEIWRYFVWSTLVFLFLNTLLSVDKVLVKHFFSPFDAGIFAAFTTLGQAVFIAVTALGGIIFPITASKQARKEDYFQPLKTISIVTFFVAGFASLVLWLFSKEFINIFFGSEYLGGAPFLGYYSIAMGIFGFIFFLSYFFMALNNFKFLYVLMAGSIVEVILISLWHDGFFQVISMFFISLIVSLAGMIFLILEDKKKNSIV